MATRLIIDGNAVYEIDEDCLEHMEEKRRRGDFPGGNSREYCGQRQGRKGRNPQAGFRQPGNTGR